MAYYTHQQRKNYFTVLGQGRPLLLLHGITNSGRAFAPQISALIKAGYQLIIVDHAGHGASQTITRPFSVKDIANDTFALLDHLALTEVTVCGVSLGGMVALNMLSAQPELFTKGVIANSFMSTNSDAFKQMAMSWSATFKEQDGPVTRFENTWPILVNEQFRQSDKGIETYQSWHAQAALADGVSLANTAQGIVGFDVSDKLHTIKQPMLFISGENDLMSDPDISKTMSSRVKHSRYVNIVGANHLSNVDSAPEFNQTLLEFLER